MYNLTPSFSSKSTKIYSSSSEEDMKSLEVKQPSLLSDEVIPSKINKYLQALISPFEVAGASIPDYNPISMVNKSLSYMFTDTATRNGYSTLFVYTPYNRYHQIRVFEQDPISGNYYFREYMTPEEDLSVNFASGRFVAGGLMAFSDTISTTTYTLGGTCSTISCNDMPPIKTLSTQTLMSYKKDPSAAALNVKLSVGAVVHAEPAPYMEVRPFHTNAVVSSEVNLDAFFFNAAVTGSTTIDPSFTDVVTIPESSLPTNLWGKFTLYANISNATAASTVNAKFRVGVRGYKMVAGTATLQNSYTEYIETITTAYKSFQLTYYADTDFIVESIVVSEACMGGSIANSFNCVIELTSNDYYSQGSRNPAAIMLLEGLNKDQTIKATAIAHYEALTDYDLTKNMIVVPERSIEDSRHIQVAKFILGNKKTFGLSSIYPLDQYKIMVTTGVFNKLVNDEHTALFASSEFIDKIKSLGKDAIPWIASLLSLYNPVLGPVTTTLGNLVLGGTSKKVFKGTNGKIFKAGSYKTPQTPSVFPPPSEILLEVAKKNLKDLMEKQKLMDDRIKQYKKIIDNDLTKKDENDVKIFKASTLDDFILKETPEAKVTGRSLYILQKLINLISPGLRYSIVYDPEKIKSPSVLNTVELSYHEVFDPVMQARYQFIQKMWYYCNYGNNYDISTKFILKNWAKCVIRAKGYIPYKTAFANANMKKAEKYLEIYDKAEPNVLDQDKMEWFNNTVREALIIGKKLMFSVYQEHLESKKIEMTDMQKEVAYFDYAHSNNVCFDIMDLKRGFRHPVKVAVILKPMYKPPKSEKTLLATSNDDLLGAFTDELDLSASASSTSPFRVKVDVDADLESLDNLLQASSAQADLKKENAKIFVITPNEVEISLDGLEPTDEKSDGTAILPFVGEETEGVHYLASDIGEIDLGGAVPISEGGLIQEKEPEEEEVSEKIQEKDTQIADLKRLVSELLKKQQQEKQIIPSITTMKNVIEGEQKKEQEIVWGMNEPLVPLKKKGEIVIVKTQPKYITLSQEGSKFNLQQAIDKKLIITQSVVNFPNPESMGQAPLQRPSSDANFGRAKAVVVPSNNTAGTTVFDLFYGSRVCWTTTQKQRFIAVAVKITLVVGDAKTDIKYYIVVSKNLEKYIGQIATFLYYTGKNPTHVHCVTADVGDEKDRIEGDSLGLALYCAIAGLPYRHNVVMTGSVMVGNGAKDFKDISKPLLVMPVGDINVKLTKVLSLGMYLIYPIGCDYEVYDSIGPRDIATLKTTGTYRAIQVGCVSDVISLMYALTFTKAVLTAPKQQPTGYVAPGTYIIEYTKAGGKQLQSKIDTNKLEEIYKLMMEKDVEVPRLFKIMAKKTPDTLLKFKLNVAKMYFQQDGPRTTSTTTTKPAEKPKISNFPKTAQRILNQTGGDKAAALEQLKKMYGQYDDLMKSFQDALAQLKGIEVKQTKLSEDAKKYQTGVSSLGVLDESLFS